MGKASEALGDSLTEFEPDLTAEQIDVFFNAADPHDPAPELLGSASTRIVYDLDRFPLCPRGPPGRSDPLASDLRRHPRPRDPCQRPAPGR